MIFLKTQKFLNFVLNLSVFAFVVSVFGVLFRLSSIKINTLISKNKINKKESPSTPNLYKYLPIISSTVTLNSLIHLDVT